MDDARTENDVNIAHELAVSLCAGGLLTPSAEPGDWETVRRALEDRIRTLLQTDPARLTRAMYLLDVSERRFAEAMDQPTQEDRAFALSLAVMERESEKIRTRLRYVRSQGPVRTLEEP